MKTFIYLFVFSFLISACSTGKKFTSRKYTSGRYVSYAKHKERISTQEIKKEKVLASAENKESVNLHPQINQTQVVEKKESIVITELPKKNGTEVKLAKLIEKTSSKIEKNKVFQTLQKKAERKTKVEAKNPASAKPDTKSLLSVILAALAFMLEIAGFILAVALEEYIFIALIGVGLALAIVALVMGIMGIRQYKKDKRDGEKNRTTLILGIVGASMGGAAIIAALYFALYALILISFA